MDVARRASRHCGASLQKSSLTLLTEKSSLTLLTGAYFGPLPGEEAGEKDDEIAHAARRGERERGRGIDAKCRTDQHEAALLHAHRARYDECSAADGLHQRLDHDRIDHAAVMSEKM